MTPVDPTPAELKPPRALPEEGILIGYSLEHERRTAPIGFQYADLPSVGVEPEEYLEPILHTGGGHIMTIAPTGAGKGVSCIVPTLLRFPGPVIVVDPKGENYAITARRRRELGQDVVLLDPLGVTGESRRGSLNPLDILDADDPLSIDNAAMLSSLLTGGLDRIDPGNTFWYQRGEQLITLILQHLTTGRPAGDRNLAMVGRILNLPTERLVGEMFEEMQASDDPHVVSLSGMLLNPAQEMVGSIVGMSQNAIGFVRGEPVSEATSVSSFDLGDITAGAPLSIYLVVPPDKLESHRNLLRLWIGTLMGALMRRRSAPPHRTLFILDEAAQLGSLDQLRQAITLMRGYGLQTWSFWQDRSQLENLYPRDWQTMYNNCRVHQSFGFTNLHAARAAADLAGFHLPEEVLKLDADEMILGIAGDEAVIAQKPNYLADPAFRGLYDENPFYRRSPEIPPAPRRPQRRYVRPPQPAPPAPVAGSTPPAPVVAGPPSLDIGDPGWFSASESVVRPVETRGGDRLVGLNAHPGVEVVSPNELDRQLRTIGTRLPGGPWNPYSTTARVLDVAFYPGHRIFEFSDPERPPAFVIRGPDDAYPLDGTNAVFHRLNELVPIDLDDETVLEYVKVFFRFVRGRHGHFEVVERIEDFHLPEGTDPAIVAAYEEHLAPLVQREVRDDGTRVLDARMRFRDSLFQVEVAVEPEGIVTIEDERLLVDEDRPLAGGDAEAAGSGDDAGSTGDDGGSTGDDT